MAAALALAERGRGRSTPNPNVGCVIVKSSRVVGRGWTQPGGRPHAEAMALARAGEAARGATLYATLEPCAHDSRRGPACADLAASAGLARVVVALGDPDPRTNGRGIAMLRANGIEVIEGIHLPEARRTMAGWLSRIERAALRYPQTRHIARWPHRATRWQQPLDHQRRGTGAYASDARAERCDPGGWRDV